MADDLHPDWTFFTVWIIRALAAVLCLGGGALLGAALAGSVSFVAGAVGFVCGVFGIFLFAVAQEAVVRLRQRRREGVGGRVVE